MRLLHNVNLTKTKIFLMLECELGLYLCCALCWERNESFIHSLIHTLPLSPIFWATYTIVLIDLWLNTYTHVHTEMKDWHQRFLENVQRNLHNWWECVGTKIPINVLYPLSLNLLKLCLFWFVKLELTHTHTHIEEKWNVSLFLNFLLIVVFLDLKLIHILKGVWCHLWNVTTTIMECQPTCSCPSFLSFCLCIIDWG
jgi:hypothetical protein